MTHFVGLEAGKRNGSRGLSCVVLPCEVARERGPLHYRGGTGGATDWRS